MPDMRFPWPIIRENLEARARRWARRRQGQDAAQLTLASRRIYILPTASGLVFGIMLATMLAGAMNYNNNLAFALTFLLAGIGITTIYHTHRTLVGLRLHCLGGAPVYAGDPLEMQFSLINDADQPREEIFLDWENCAPVAGGVPAQDSRMVRLPLTTRQRGFMALPGLRVTTRAPLGLMRAWAWVHMDPHVLVWPRPAAAGVQAERPQCATAAAGARQQGEDDFAGLRNYQQGDSPRRIAWKSYARYGDLLVRDFRGGSAEDPVWIDWDALPPSDVETRVARLTRLVIDAFTAGGSWGLRLPGVRIEPAGGREQLHRCLRCLATAGLPGGSA